MKCMAAIMSALAIGMTATDASALQRPDFSGEWTQRAEQQGRRGGGGQRGAGQRGSAGDMGSGWGRTITVNQTATTLVVQYEFFVRGDMQPPLKFVYALDGSETRANVMLGRGIQPQTSRTSWVGDTLAITTVHAVNEADLGPDARVEVRRRVWLDGPASLVVETTRSGVLGAPATTTRTVYTK